MFLACSPFVVPRELRKGETPSMSEEKMGSPLMCFPLLAHVATICLAWSSSNLENPPKKRQMLACVCACAVRNVADVNTSFCRRDNVTTLAGRPVRTRFLGV